MINTDSIEQEIKQEEQLNRIDDTNGTMVNFEQCFKLYTTWHIPCNSIH